MIGMKKQKTLIKMVKFFQNKYLFNSLKSMEKRTMEGKLELPTFNCKINVDVALDWIKALKNFFECEEILEKQRVKMIKSKLKGATLTWCNFI